MSAERIPYWSPAEYLAIERKATHKSEYLSGQMFAMAGASREHNLIAFNIGGLLFAQLRGRSCEAYIGDMRVLSSTTGLYTYPDLTVVCGEPQFTDSIMDTLQNPTVIIEVLSPSTEAYERGEKFAHYRQILSLTEYVVVSQAHPRIERFTRQKSGNWLLAEANGLESEVFLASIDCQLPLVEVYGKIIFPSTVEAEVR